MNSSSAHSHFSSLLPLWQREHAAGRTVVLATLIHTDGSTYRKPGAQLLIAQSGEYAGLLSGGCLEADLREHARSVFASGKSCVVRYHLREEDALFGVGAGCIGALQILLQPVSSESRWQPMATLESHWRADQHQPVALVCRSNHEAWLGATVTLDQQGITPQGETFTLPWTLHAPRNTHPAQTGFMQSLSAECDVFVLHAVLPPRLLICGAGPDVLPVTHIAQLLGWKLTIADHRPGLLQHAHLAQIARLPTRLDAAPSSATVALITQLQAADAVVIMSHHLDGDLYYLRLCAQHARGYVGLLGPATRRERLLSELGEVDQSFKQRLHAPVGLDIGASTPETIALAIIAEIQQCLSRNQRQAHSEHALIACEPQH